MLSLNCLWLTKSLEYLVKKILHVNYTDGAGCGGNIVDVIVVASHVQLFLTPWTVARQAPPSLGFPRQEHWSELPFPSPGDLPHPGIEPASPALAGGFLTSEPPGKPERVIYPFRNYLVLKWDRLHEGISSDALYVTVASVKWEELRMTGMSLILKE